MYNIWDNINYVTEVIRSHPTRLEIIKELGRSPTTTTYRRLKKFIAEHGVDVSHLTQNTPLRKHTRLHSRQLSNDEIFCKNSHVSSVCIKRRILTDRLIEYKCAECGNSGTWRDKIISLQLEHKDGNHTNNELNNLCYLCPNCHSQTDTYCGRNKPKISRNKTRSLQEYRYNKRQLCIISNQPLVDRVLASGIDFSKIGWSKKVAVVINKRPQKVKDWMQRYMKEVYLTKCK